MQLQFCTLTGVDEKTNLVRLDDLSAAFPFAEWGFLYSPKLQGQPGRYPSVEFLHEMFNVLPDNINVALHVCGKGVSGLLEGESVVTGLVNAVKERGGRIQLNFNQTAKPIDLSLLADFLEANPELTVITQQNSANESVWEDFTYFHNHTILHDASGGRGISPEFWPEPIPAFNTGVGYAGGLGPENIEQQIREIDVLLDGAPFWVDMEGSLREEDENGNDWLVLDRCEQVLTNAHKVITAGQAVDHAEAVSGLLGSLLSGINADNQEVYEQYANHKVLETARIHAEDFNPSLFHFELIHPLYNVIDGLLLKYYQDPEVRFIFKNYPYVENHFRHQLERFEGMSCVADKARTIIHHLIITLVTRRMCPFNYEGEHTYNLPKKVFVDQEEALEFYRGIVSLHFGNPERYVKSLANLGISKE